MKRSVALLLSLLLLLPLTACGKGADYVTEEEILPVARDLITRSVPINIAFLGDGIPVAEGAIAIGKYYPTDEAWLAAYGITSLDGLKAEAEAVYSAPLVAILYEKAFPEGNVYYDYQERSITQGKGILILAEREPMLSWYRGVTHEYLFDTMRLTDAGTDRAKVTLDVKVTKGGEVRTHSLELALVLTEGGWRCDTFTPVAFQTVDEE